MTGEKLKILDLFSGIGGFSLGLERAGMETIAFCEKDKFCQKVLNKHWPNVPIFEDILDLKKEDINETVDVICGGFPCQPFSVAGRKKGTEDDRDLWPEMFRVIQEQRPTWVIGENVANFTDMAFQRTKINLESEGYQVQPFIIPACGLEARHQRNRVWIIAYSDSAACRMENRKLSNEGRIDTKDRREGLLQKDRTSQDVGSLSSNSASSDTNSERLERYNVRREGEESISKKGFTRNRSICSEWEFTKEWRAFEPRVCGVANGVSNRVDRIKSLGNAVVPQIVEVIGRAIVQSQGLPQS